MSRDGRRTFTTTAHDHSGIAITITTLLMTYSILFCLIRLYTRTPILRSLGVDDVFSILATVFGALQTIVSCIAISHGFGKSLNLLSQTQLVAIEKTQFSGDLLYILTLSLAKCSMVLLYIRITCIKKQRVACYGLLGAIACWGAVSLIIQASRCDPLPWKLANRSRPGLIPSWDAVTALDVIIEVTIFAMSIWLVWDLQMSPKSKKVVMFAFSLRLPVIVPAILRLFYLRSSIHSGDLTFAGVVPFICAQVEMHFGTMATTIPCLKPFVGSFNTGWGTVDTRGVLSHGMMELDSKGSAAQHGYE